MSDLPRKMMRVLPDHLDELNAHIKELDDDIDHFMKPEEKKASKVIQDISDIGISEKPAGPQREMPCCGIHWWYVPIRRSKTKTLISLRILHGSVHIAGRKGLTLQLHILC